jgi:hypothetical protein
MSIVLVTERDWNELGVEEMRRLMGNKLMDADVIMAVLQGLQMWGGVQFEEERMSIDCREFLVWVRCLNNRVIDEDACQFLKRKFRVNVEPDKKVPRFVVPEEFVDEPRVRDRTRGGCNNQLYPQN